MSPADDPHDDLDTLERTAVELAASAGAELASALTRTLSVRYKTASATGGRPRDPVSDLDRSIEEAIRRQVLARHPGHVLIGEESAASGEREADYAWAVDPIDGTTNFLHGFPLFACSIGVLWRGEPVVGAVWCSTSHELRPGVFHARRGGDLRFENRALNRRQDNAEVVSRLLGDPGRLSADVDFDRRSTGSAAIECAFVAAGIMSSSLLRAPNVWDVAGGVVLAQAARKKVWTFEGGAWVPFRRFGTPVLAQGGVAERVASRAGDEPLESAARSLEDRSDAFEPHLHVDDARRGPAPSSKATPTSRVPDARDVAAVRSWRGTLLVGTDDALDALRALSME